MCVCEREREREREKEKESLIQRERSVRVLIPVFTPQRWKKHCPQLQQLLKKMLRTRMSLRTRMRMVYLMNLALKYFLARCVAAAPHLIVVFVLVLMINFVTTRTTSEGRSGSLSFRQRLHCQEARYQTYNGSATTSEYTLYVQ